MFKLICSNFGWIIELVCWIAFVQVHGDYSEDVGVKMERPAEETVAEVETEVVGA